MRVGLDATPLLGQATGVGRHVAGLLAGFGELAEPAELILTAFTWRGADGVTEYVRPPRVRAARRRAPARALRAAWRFGGTPPVQWLAGPLDVFHATNFVLPPTGGAAGVLTVHDTAFAEHPGTVSRASRAYRRLVPDGLRRAGAVCCPTRTVASALTARYGLDPAKVVVTPNGLSDTWLAGPLPAAPAWLAARGLPERFVLFVGTDEPRKNLPVLVAAHRELAGAPPLLIVGPAGWGAQQAAGGRVFRAGYLPEKELAGVVAAADALVLPSRDEGFGIPALEAFACGVPVVASDLPALREVLGDLAGYAPPGDAAALATALGAALQAGRAAGAAARRAHAARFTWRRTAEAALSGYRIASSR